MRSRSTALVLAFAAVFAAAAPARAGGDKALLIGISQYADPEMNDLAYADEDVKTFASILKDFGGYGDPDMNVLLNENATKKNIVDSIVALVKDSQKRPLDHFIMMYAGHGLPSSIDASRTNSFLAPHDAYLNQFFPEGAGNLIGNETFINKAWLVRQLSAMNAKNIIIILDSCYSGARDFGDLYADDLGFKTELVAGGGGKRGIVVVRKKGADAALDRRIAFLASSRENQPSAEYSELRHGALSYTIFKYLEGVRGDTEVGVGKDVSVDDMYTGLSALFDTVQVNGQALSRVHQPVLVPIPDYDAIKDMRFVTMRGVKPKATLIAMAPPNAPAPAPPPPAPRSGALYLDTGSDQCEVRVDGDPTVLRSNDTLVLAEGRHLISLYLAGTNYNHTITVDVRAGENRRLEVALRGRLAVESYSAGWGSAPAMDVYLDEQHVGRAGLRLKNIAAGTHTLRVVAEGVSKSREIEIRPDSPLLVRYKIIRPPKQERRRRDDSGAGDVTF
jgi:hypothetical protein